MSLRVLGCISVLLVYGCGSSDDDSPEAWCPAVPQLTTDEGTDLTGEANTYERVKRIKERYETAILNRCPGITAIGIGKATASEAIDDPDIPLEGQGRLSDAETDHVISISVLSEGDRPEGQLFLEGVPVEFIVTGPFQPL